MCSAVHTRTLIEPNESKRETRRNGVDSSVCLDMHDLLLLVDVVAAVATGTAAIASLCFCE